MSTYVDPDALRFIDSQIETVAKISDGDTLRVFLQRDEPYDEFNRHTIYTDREIFPDGIPVRLVWVQCPDLPDRTGKYQARADTVRWIGEHEKDGLWIRTWAGGGFGRFLADVYYIGSDGFRHSLSQHLLSEANEGQGWPFYEPK